MKSLTYFYVTVLLLVWMCSCSNDSYQQELNSGSNKKQRQAFSYLSGNTMGTKYHVSYQDKRKRTFQTDIDLLLAEINQEVSTYEENSVISQFNKAKVDTFWFDEASFSGISSNFKHFIVNFQLAKKVYEVSQGAMDPTVMPLVNYWGFGYTEKSVVTSVDSANVRELKKLIGFDKVQLIQSPRMGLTKANPDVQLDFSAFAKGYGVDAVSDFLMDQGVENFFVEIGGEVRVHGVNPEGIPWRIGINVPLESASTGDIFKVLPLKDKAIATSGNYRNYREVKGKKYGHTIDPKTGYPEKNNLLSASVISDECIVSDAFATACMVVGVDEAIKMAEQVPYIDVYLIYGKDHGTMGVKKSRGLKVQD